MSNKDDTVQIINIVDSTLKKVQTRSLDISFNELLDMYMNQELIIDPDFQRNFQWSEARMSRFIESLILEMPIPPIFFVELKDGVYELIDGLQRISSYIYFRGKLDAPQHNPPLKSDKDKLVLTGCDIIEELNGKTYDDLGTTIQIRLKRHFIRAEIVRKESDPMFKYHMFKRLNTGGELLSEQQIRNCTIKLLDDKFNKFLIEMSQKDHFKCCTQNISQKQKVSAFDQELVLRFFAFKNNMDAFKHDIAEFLTDYMESVSNPDDHTFTFSYDEEEEIFDKTFTLLSKTLGEHIFSRVSKNGNYISGFSALHYEIFTLGVQKALDRIDTNNPGQISMLEDLFGQLKRDPEFYELATGGGKNSIGELRKRIGFMESKLDELYESINC